MNKLSRLDREIVRDEDDADAKRWEQAQEVVRRLDAGESERDVAASWVNARTGQPYSLRHIQVVAAMWRKHGDSVPSQRPAWSPTYDGMHDKGTRGERAQAQAPTTVAAAEKLVANLLKGDVEVQQVILDGLLAAVPDAPAPASRRVQGGSEITAALGALADMMKAARRAVAHAPFDQMDEMQLAKGEVLIRATEGEIGVWRANAGGDLSDEALAAVTEGGLR